MATEARRPRKRRSRSSPVKTDKVVLSDKQIHFATGQWVIPGGSDATLAEIAQTLKDNPDWHVTIEGYTDNVGSKASNLKLSQECAHSVMKWLVDHGVDQSRLSAKGYGKSHPVADEATEAGRAENRRVEIVRTSRADYEEELAGQPDETAAARHLCLMRGNTWPLTASSPQTTEEAAQARPQDRQ